MLNLTHRVWHLYRVTLSWERWNVLGDIVCKNSDVVITVSLVLNFKPFTVFVLDKKFNWKIDETCIHPRTTWTSVISPNDENLIDENPNAENPIRLAIASVISFSCHWSHLLNVFLLVHCKFTPFGWGWGLGLIGVQVQQSNHKRGRNHRVINEGICSFSSKTLPSLSA